MGKESFLLYHGYYEPIKPLSLEDKGRLFEAIFEYSINGIEPDIKSNIFMAFQFFKNQLNQDSKKYNKIVERNVNNGKNGGRPITQNNPKNPVGLKKPKKADTVTVTDTVTDNDTVTDFLKWGELIANGEDQYWNAITHNRKVTQDDVNEFISAAIRYKWKISSQSEFRISLNGFKPFKKQEEKKSNPNPYKV